MFDLPFILLRMDYIPGPPIELNEASLIALGVVAAACLAVSVVGVMLLVFGGKEAGVSRGTVTAAPVAAAPAAPPAAPKGTTAAHRPEGATRTPRPEGTDAGSAPAQPTRASRPGGGSPKLPRGEGGRPK